MLLLLALGCDPGDAKIDDTTGTTDTSDTGGDTHDTTPPPPPVALSAAVAFDPLAGGPLEVTVTSDDTPNVSVSSADGAVVYEASASFSWDGHLQDGSWATPGVYTITATAGQDSATTTVALVRIGMTAAYADDDDGATATRVPLYWAKSKAVQDVAEPVSAVDAIDGEDGAHLLPALGASLDEATAGAAEPTAWPYDSRPILTLVPGDSTVFAGTGLDLTAVDVAVDGWTVLSGNPLAPGVPVVLQKDDALAAGPSVVEGDLTLSFTVEGTDTAFLTEAVPWRAYALLGVPTWEFEGDAYTAWVAAVDPALRAIAGVTPDTPSVLDALVHWIYNDSGLEYDTVSGASAYVYYTHGWDEAEFSFTAFLRRAYGTIVNCTDCASILLTYANMLGAQLSYTIILQNFSLNYIQAIGGTEFDHCPFGDWGCGFSYHAVTTNDAGATIWDATLALDGDDDPGSLPSTLLEVQGVEGEEYLDRLVMSGDAAYYYQAQSTLK